MRPLFRPVLLVAAILAIPLLPALALGPTFEDWLGAWLEGSPASVKGSEPGLCRSPAVVAAVVVGLLAGDLVLPVPSSLVGTVAGRALGTAGGMAASWVGLTLGAAIGFGLARWFGRPLALRFSSEEDLTRMDELTSRHGLWILVVARPLPVLAEASVLLLGTTGLSWGRFLVPVGLANLGIAAAYALLGSSVRLPTALAASIAIPLAATILARAFLPGRKKAE